MRHSGTTQSNGSIEHVGTKQAFETLADKDHESKNFFWVEDRELWICTGYREARGILRDTRGRFTVKRMPIGSPGLPQSGLETLAVHVLRPVDEPVHQCVRDALAQRFTAHALAPLKPFLQSQIEQRLTLLEDRSHMQLDLINKFAGPLSLATFSKLLGLPDTFHDKLSLWCQAYFTVSLGGTNLLVQDPHQAALLYQQASQALDEARRTLLELASERFAHPRDDVISDLVRLLLPERVADEAYMQTRFHIIAANCLLFLFGGYHMATSMFASTLWWLWKSPREREMFARSPGLFPALFDEVLRLSTPYLILVRQAQQDVLITGNRVRRGQHIHIVLTAANRDARVFPDPDTFLLERKNRQPSLAFGSGKHMCMGIECVFLLLQMAIPAFFQHFPTVHMNPELPWTTTATMRYLTHLPFWPNTPRVKPVARTDLRENLSDTSFAPLVSLQHGRLALQLPCTQPYQLMVSVDPAQGSITLAESRQGQEGARWATPLSALGTIPIRLQPQRISMENDLSIALAGESSEEEIFVSEVYHLLTSILHLSASEVHANTDFFDAGGNSLTMMTFLTALRMKLDLEVEPSVLFEHPQFADLASTLFLSKQRRYKESVDSLARKEAHP